MGDIIKEDMQKRFYKSRKNNCVIPSTLSGVITIELSYLMPLILFLFVTVMYTVFYYHDKNILIGAASETAIVGAQLKRKPDENDLADLSDFYQERIQGKLILFAGAQAEISLSDKRVDVKAYAARGKMKIQTIQKAPIVKPEKKIRQKRILEELVGREE